MFDGVRMFLRYLLGSSMGEVSSNHSAQTDQGHPDVAVKFFVN